MLTVDHLLSWDWAIFIFYPSPLSKLLIFWISRLQTAPNTTQRGLTHLVQHHGNRNHNPIAFTQLFGLHQQHHQRDIAHELGETKSRRKAKRVSSRERRVRWLQADNTCQWQNIPAPESFTAISSRTWFGLEALPVCNFSKQKHWSACAEAEKGIKLKYYCCFSDKLSQQYKLWLEVGGCPGLPSQSTCEAGLAEICFSNSMPWISCQLQRHLFIPVKIPQTGWGQILGLLP